MSVEIVPLTIKNSAELLEIRPRKFIDDRGFFSETYNRADLAAAGIHSDFVQDNHSLSKEKGTVRGLHFQAPPFAQAKLIRVVRGSIFDVAVDIRKGSPTYGLHAGIVIGAEAWNQLFIPVGFAHGFCTLEPDTEVVYKVDALYSPEHDHGLLWNDPDLGIEWPVKSDSAVLSEKDRNHPTLSQLPPYFQYA